MNKFFLKVNYQIDRKYKLANIYNELNINLKVSHKEYFLP